MSMTEAEALEIIKRKSSIPMGNETFDEIEEAYDIAIAALEKQIPKKMDRYYCPICRHYFEDGEAHNYCPNCGQKLDWE